MRLHGPLALRAIGLLCLLLALPTAGSVAASSSGRNSLDGLRVKGDQLVDGSGAVVHLHGVNRSGTEYACIQGWGIFDGPATAASIRAMKSWNVNIVRVPLNEDCWLGLNRKSGIGSYYRCHAVTPLRTQDFGAKYVGAIKNYVALLHQNGMYAELSLIWGAPGHCRATYQPSAPDEDHSPAMWRQMALAFKNDPNVILAPWGETTVGWKCFLNGCKDEATFGTRNRGYRTAGMQQAVTIIRKAGYTGVISIPCIDYANQCADYNGSSWLRSHPRDLLNNLVAEAHVYGNNQCGAQNNGACLGPQYGNLAKSVPVIWGETGETYDDSECTGSNMKILLPWADVHISGYMAWTWDTWGDCLSLIKDYASAAPADPYAQYVQSHYLSLAA